MNGQGREGWGTRLGVILAVAGSAVGLGNFLRFPGVVVQNGGGAFMIPYFCALIFLGIPIGWAEWTMGRYGGTRGYHSAPAILGIVGKGRIARYFGVIGLLVPLVVVMYYSVIEAWCLQYAWMYLSNSIELSGDKEAQIAMSRTIFESVSGIGADGSLFSGIPRSVIFWALVFSLNLWLIYRGLSRGVELFCRFAMPGMAVAAILVLIRVLTLGTPDPAHPEQSVWNGLGFMWNPDLSQLGNFETWLAAAGQVFFSLSVGFGVIINYASYLRKKDDVVLSGLTASATNEVFEVGFGGLITITAAFVFLGASGTEGGTFGLGFQTLPVVFAHMGALGPFVGALWFFMLFLAAITSSLSMFQPVKAFLGEALGLSHGRSVVLLAVLSALGALWVMVFSKDLVALDTMDFWVGTLGIFVMASVQIICFGWIWGVDEGLKEAHLGAEMRIPRLFRFVIKYVAPIYLLVVFVGFCVQKLPGTLSGLAKSDVAQWTLGVVGLVVVLLVAFTWLGEKRWLTKGADREPYEEEEA